MLYISFSSNVVLFISLHNSSQLIYLRRQSCSVRYEGGGTPPSTLEDGKSDGRMTRLTHNISLTGLYFQPCIAHGCPTYLYNNTPDNSYVNQSASCVSRLSMVDRLPSRYHTRARRRSRGTMYARGARCEAAAHKNATWTGSYAGLTQRGRERDTRLGRDA